LASLPAEEKNALLKHIYETLEMRVGMRLADQMTNEQLDEFETFYNAKDDAGAFHWLETNFPNYKDIVADEFAKLKAEVGQSAPQILASSQQSQQQPTSQQPMPAAAEPGQSVTPPLQAPEDPLPPTETNPQPPQPAA
jgi:predicted RNA-binding Zn ribbon-like protein